MHTTVRTKQFKEGTKEPLTVKINNSTDLMRCKTCRNFKPQEPGASYGYCPFKEGAISGEKLKCIHYE